jgi:hypothetical protein
MSSTWSLADRTTVHVQQHTPDDGPCETETCRVVVEGHEIWVDKPDTQWRDALMTVFVYIYQVIK